MLDIRNSAREHQVADEHRLGRNTLGAGGLEGDVTVAVAEHVVDRVGRRHAVRNGANAADALNERDGVVGRAAKQEVLEATPQVAVSVRVNDDVASAHADLHAEVTLDTRDRVDFVIEYRFQ